MKIRTQLIISTAVFALVLIIIAVSVIVTNQQLDRLSKQRQIADSLGREANDISYLSAEYILHHEDLQRIRWESAYASFSSDLAAFEPRTPEEQALVASIRNNNQGLKEVFDSVVSVYPASSSLSGVTEGSTLQVSWSRMAVQTQGMVAETTRLSRIVDTEMQQTQQAASFLIFALLGTFVAFLFTSSLIFYRRTLVAIGHLQDGAQIIGTGNLNYVLDESPDDEIGNLSRSLNRMTADLREVTASKSELEREVTERKRAEENLKQNNETLSALNDEFSEMQEELHRRNDALLRNEHELAVKNAQLQGLFDYSAASLVLFDAKKPYTVLAHNKYYQDLWSEPFRSNGMVGKNLFDYVPNVEVSGVMALYDEVVATRQPRILLNFPYDGMERGRTYWNWHLSPIIQGGEVVALAHMGIDVTNEVTAWMIAEKAAGALKVSEERFRELAEKAGSIILRFDAAGRITYFNEFAEHFFGFPRDEILGKPAVGTILPAMDTSGKDLDKMLRDIVANPEQYAISENENIRKNGERVWIRWTNKPVYNPDGTIREFTTIGSDITDRRRAEKELMRREKQLKEALAEKEILLSEIHHRVKNNLAAFISLLSLEGSTEETPAGLGLKQDLQNRARSMALIHETLYRTHQFSEVDMDVYLTPLIDQVVNSYSSPQCIRTIVEAKGVVLNLARATPAGLIINELVTNSLKHAFPKDAVAGQADNGEPCTIGIRLVKDDGSYVLTVYDNGVGMPAGFDPQTAKTLGLKLVNFLAKHQMRAKVEVNSTKGTEFIFRFKD